MNVQCRDSTNRFWGDNKGSDAQKNQHANVILRRIFRESVWINVHLLPVRVLPLALIEACICSLYRKKKNKHDITICEVRTPAGYGARWSGDGSAFRGFLEPHVEGAAQTPPLLLVLFALTPPRQTAMRRAGSIDQRRKGSW